MKILYDYQAFIQRIGGVSRYHAELIKNFPNEAESMLPPILSDNVYLREMGIKHRQFMPNYNGRRKYDVYKALNIIQSRWWLATKNCDIFHPTFFNPYFVGHCKKPVVVTMHDLNHWKYPELTVKAGIVQQKERAICNVASHIIAISEETKEDLMRYIEIPEKKITVIYHGIDQELTVCHEKPLVEYPYLLYIGGRSGYKNFKIFLQAFVKVDKRVNLVCTGGAFSTEEMEMIASLDLANRVCQMFVCDNDLNNLLCNAIAFVYPSLAEGFGMPILEAFRCNCPCIISDIKCFHEVAGDAACYLNPQSPEDMATVINNTIYNETKIQKMRKRGIERMKEFSWKKTANETLHVYTSLM